jgi:hypothetical protein
MTSDVLLPPFLVLESRGSAWRLGMDIKSKKRLFGWGAGASNFLLLQGWSSKKRMGG